MITEYLLGNDYELETPTKKNKSSKVREFHYFCKIKRKKINKFLPIL